MGDSITRRPRQQVARMLFYQRRARAGCIRTRVLPRPEPWQQCRATRTEHEHRRRPRIAQSLSLIHI
eukprot:7174238-Pyramimonas_sp.AAC.1